MHVIFQAIYKKMYAATSKVVYSLFMLQNTKKMSEYSLGKSVMKAEFDLPIYLKKVVNKGTQWCIIKAQYIHQIIQFFLQYHFSVCNIVCVLL